MAVDCGGHFLSGKQSHNFLLRGNILPGLGLLQRLTNEVGEHLDLCARVQLLNPLETSSGTMSFHQKHTYKLFILLIQVC